MENVKGLLSATINNNRVFDKILKDLQEPRAAIANKSKKSQGHLTTEYEILSLTCPDTTTSGDLRNFVVKMEHYGIPQARHRLILLGIRKDILEKAKPTIEPFDKPLHSLLTGASCAITYLWNEKAKV